MSEMKAQEYGMTDEQKIADLLDGEWHDAKPHHAGLSWPLVERMQLMSLPPINRIRLLGVYKRRDIPSEDLNDQVLRGLGGSPEVGTSPINRVDDATTKGQKNPVRSREEHIIELGARIFVGMRNHTDSMCEAQRYIDEAEARGAAEQRRKDGEGQEVAYYIDHRPGSGSPPYAVRSLEQCAFPEKGEPVYTHPANVAALEGRIAELEEKLKHAERWAEVAHTSCMGTGPKQALGETLNGLHQFLRAALKPEGTPS